MGTTWKIVLATVIIFGAGVLTGGLLVSVTDRSKPTRPKRANEFSPPLWPAPRGVAQGHSSEVQTNLDRQTVEFIASIQRELSLTPEQRERVAKILRDGQEKTRLAWSKVGPELRKEMNEVKERIRTELTPEQRSRFEELLKQRQHRRAEESQGQPRGPRDLPPTGAGSKPPRNPPSENR